MSRQLYMCPPDYYQIEYEINPWMHTDQPVDSARAAIQWNMLVRTYTHLGADVTFIPARPNLPELTFPGDSIFLVDDTAIISKFRYAQRQPESIAIREWAESQELKIIELPAEARFEGNAEAVIWNDILLAGFGPRSNAIAHSFIRQELDVQLVALRLRFPFYHFDVALCALDQDLIAYCPSAFDNRSIEIIESLAPRKIRVSLSEAMNLACNSFRIGSTVVLSSQRCPRFAADLESMGYTVKALDMSEFAKAGGGVKCLTLERYIFQGVSHEIECQQRNPIAVP